MHNLIQPSCPLRKSHMLPTSEPRVFYMETHVFHIKANIFLLFS